MPAYQPKTGARCSCRRGIERDNCPTCEGTGWVIDFAAIRARPLTAAAKHCVKCGAPIYYPQLADDEDELCSGCADD